MLSIGIANDHTTQHVHCVIPLLFIIIIIGKALIVSKYVKLNEYAGMQVQEYNYLQDYREPFSSSKPNEEWPHIALHYYNESRINFFYINWVIVDRLTETRLISLWSAFLGRFEGRFLCAEFFYKNKL